MKIHAEVILQQEIENTLTESSTDDPIPEETTVEAEVSEDTIEYHQKRVKELEAANHSLIEKLHENTYKIDEKSDKLCSRLRFLHHTHPSHTVQMVANAAPLATIFSIYQYNEISETRLSLFGFFFFYVAIGLAMRVIRLLTS